MTPEELKRLLSWHLPSHIPRDELNELVDDLVQNVQDKAKKEFNETIARKCMDVVNNEDATLRDRVLTVLAYVGPSGHWAQAIMDDLVAEIKSRCSGCGRPWCADCRVQAPAD